MTQNKGHPHVEIGWFRSSTMAGVCPMVIQANVHMSIQGIVC